MMSTLLNGAGMAVLLVEISVNKVETSWLESLTAPLEGYIPEGLDDWPWLATCTE